jgi:hypothetical protein
MVDLASDLVLVYLASDLVLDDLAWRPRPDLKLALPGCPAGRVSALFPFFYLITNAEYIIPNIAILQ